MDSGNAPNNKRSRYTFGSGLLIGLALCLVSWGVFLFALNKPQSQIKLETTVKPALFGLINRLGDTIAFSKLPFHNILLMPTEKPDTRTLAFYDLTITPRTDFRIAGRMTANGEELQKELVAHLPKKEIATATSLRRLAVEQLLQQAEEVMIDSICAQNAIKVSTDNVATSVENLDSNTVALIVTYESSDPPENRRYRRLVRKEEWQTNQDAIKQEFIDDCVDRIRLCKIVQKIKAADPYVGILNEKSTRPEIIEYLRKQCVIKIGVPQLDEEELLDIFVKASRNWSGVVFAPKAYEVQQPSKIPTEKTAAVGDAIPQEIKESLETQYQHTQQIWGSVSFYFDWVPNNGLRGMQNLLVLRDRSQETVFAGSFVPLMENTTAKRATILLCKGNTLWYLSSEEECLWKKEHYKLEDAFRGQPDLIELLSNLKKANRSYMAKVGGKECGVFVFEETNAKTGQKLLKELMFRPDDGVLIKMRETVYDGDKASRKTVTLFTPLLNPQKVRGCLQQVEQTLDAMPSLEVQGDIVMSLQ